MAQKYLFSVKIESVKYITKTEVVSITNPFDEQDIKRIVENHLAEKGLEPRYSTFTYHMREGNLFVDGEAYKQSEKGFSPDIAFIG